MVIIFFIIEFNLKGSFSLSYFLSNIFLIQVLNQSGSLPAALWTLSYEVLAYAFLPLIFWIIINKNAKKNILFLWFFLIFIIFISKFFYQNFFQIIKYMPCFISGIIAFIFFNKKKIISYYFFVLYIFLGCIFIPICVGVFKVQQNLLCILFTFPLVFLIAYSKEIKFNLINILCNKIAKYSYGIYLFQGLALFIIFDFSNLVLPLGIKIIFTVLLTLLFSYAGYTFIERPLIKIGKYLSSKCKNY
jgi:peptidoglycan/LPS O-acetylase OafA/YrhL